MRRRTQKSLTHLLILLFILGLILFLNRPASPHKLFAWHRVTYRTRATSLPAPNGVCPGLSESGRPALVVSHVDSDGDTGWLEELKTKYHVCVYHIDTASSSDKEKKTLQVPTNRAHESITYLTFLIDNYASIPRSGAVFIHGSRFAWHNDDPAYDNLSLLKSLNLPFALHASGYHNLRCDWSLSTCPPSAGPQGSLENSVQAVLQPWSARTVSDRGLPKALEEIFGSGSRLGRTDTVRAQCCAQFAVSQEGIWQHSREEYVALRQWLLDGMDGRRGAAPKDDRVAGRMVSYIWHILFVRRAGDGVDLGELNRRACPSAEECYCRLYGRCGLRCATPGSCLGQYALPKHLRLPEDWAERHS
ncbi:hypothetical protein P170DRAFT_459358 [Aspergillus steynii IBT 23096]|uniref:Uncharacterized protein n=1 Tax=Aspergillus steynii IBT 23096 TaxID=1392250 RepID=A0A2I2FSY8_9EURO|nr:uncharacterized protein P170DRAFT_459358 [Aspergillus steynii IBT 23096]PLB43753.1 hypothetical protein P170DRAFT_459358 [Aspergillus steynii IBT 23096]